MDPLSTYLLTVLQNEKSVDTRTFHLAEAALNEMGYWLLSRPVEYPRDKMPPCGISNECRLVGQFKTYYPPFAGCEGFDVIMDVYAEPDIALEK